MKKNESTKRMIIEKTTELIQTNSNVTIKDIADACYVNIAAVNYHFGSKDELIELVLNTVVDHLKTNVAQEIAGFPNDAHPEVILEKLLEYVYAFALENIGVVRFFFLQKGNQHNASNLLVDSFFTDNDFTKVIFEKLSASTGIKDKDALRARYLVLFSSFAIPLFIQITQQQTSKELQPLPFLMNDNFRDLYIRELLRIIR